MKLYEEFKLYENMWDDEESESANYNAADAIVKLGGATIDFSQAKTLDQIYAVLNQAFDKYSEDWKAQISYGEFCTKFVPELKANSSVPTVVKKLFTTATNIHNIVFNDCDDDVLTVCYKALKAAGFDTNNYGVDEIVKFLSDYEIAYFIIENDRLYIQLSNPDSTELGDDLIEYMKSKELSGNSASDTILKKIALYKIVDIRPEQGPRQHYKEKIKTPTSWSELQKIIAKELLDLKKEIIEYGNVGSVYDESTYDLADPDEVEEYENMKKSLDGDFSVNWPKIKKAVNNAKSGNIIDVFELDYDDFDVSWEGSIEYNIVIL